MKEIFKTFGYSLLSLLFALTFISKLAEIGKIGLVASILGYAIIATFLIGFVGLLYIGRYEAYHSLKKK